MIIVSIWRWFIFLMSICKIDTSHYLLFCFSMFYVTYLYNQILPTKLTPKFLAIFLIIPSIILCRIAYVYNYFLSFNPLDEHVIVFIIFFYFYLLIYISWESY